MEKSLKRYLFGLLSCILLASSVDIYVFAYDNFEDVADISDYSEDIIFEESTSIEPDILNFR